MSEPPSSPESPSSPEPPPSAPPAPAEPAPGGPQLRVINQYVKDLSFENPGAPQSLPAFRDGNPRVDVRVDAKASQVDGGDHEVELHLTVQAQSHDAPAFVAELVYAGLFRLIDVPDDKRQPVLLIECPRLLFPFARRVLADASRDGGFPPLMLDPIDFVHLYRQAQQQQAQTAPAPGSKAPGSKTPGNKNQATALKTNGTTPDAG